MSSEGKKHAKKNPIVHYVEESYQELRKVTWPTRNKAVRLTFLVLGVCLVAAVIIGALDFIFGAGHRYLLDLAPAQQVPGVSSDVQATTGQEVPISAGDIGVQPVGITATTADGTPVQPSGVSAESTSGEPISVTTVDSGPVTVGGDAAAGGSQ